MRSIAGVFLLAIGLAATAAGQTTTPVTKRPPAATTVRPPAAIRAIPGTQPTAPPAESTAEPTTPPAREYQACTSARDCPTGECWDGVCCNATCRGNCVSCKLPGYEGLCTPVPDGQDPRRACCISQGGHPACNAVCMSGQCMFPDVGVPCGVCSGCDGVGRCTLTPPDDGRCGVVSCQGLSNYCRKYEDLQAGRCAALGVCKSANDPATCTVYRDFYSGVDPSGVRRECATGKAMNCYQYGTHWVWQDGAVIKYCNTGRVCEDCAPQQPTRSEDWTPPKQMDPEPR